MWNVTGFAVCVTHARRLLPLNRFESNVVWCSGVSSLSPVCALCVVMWYCMCVHHVAWFEMCIRYLIIRIGPRKKIAIFFYIDWDWSIVITIRPGQLHLKIKKGFSIDWTEVVSTSTSPYGNVRSKDITWKIFLILNRTSLITWRHTGMHGVQIELTKWINND